MKFIVSERLNKQATKLTDRLTDFIDFDIEVTVENAKLVVNIADGVDKTVDIYTFTFNDSNKVNDILTNTIDLIRYYYL